SYPEENSWNEAVKGYEHAKEGEERCKLCFQYRLNQVAKQASSYKFDYFATTLTLSPLKNTEIINRIGKEVELSYPSTTYFPSNFKKEDGFKKSCERSREYNLYRQNYCGCLYSKR
ncbi:epoxyqueuosine reductase QueH, partial [Candidatus Auribacterota bacterium]